MIAAVDGIHLDVGEHIVHPAHIPLEAEAKAAGGRRSGNVGPCMRLLSNGKYTLEIVVDSCSVNLSPMSVTVRFDYYEEFSHYFEGPINISVVLEDGTEHKVGILSSYREFRKNEGCIKEINAVFDEPIVTSDATYIKYGETIIPLK